MARPLKFFLGLMLCIVGVLVLALALGPKPAPLAPLPNPNGYDDLVKAGRFIPSDAPDWTTLRQDELQTLVATNLESLKLARTGLSRECRVPLDFDPTNTAMTQEMGLVKRLAQAFAAEGKLAELEHRPSDAAASYLDAVRLGHQGARGGLLIHSLVGIAAESIGLKHLEYLARTLDGKQCQDAVAVLEALESQRESYAVVLQHEHKWARRTGGLQGQLARLVMFRSMRQMEQRFEGKLQAQQVRTGRLILDLAARAYEQEKGERPKTLAQMVPAYLKAIPQDPLTGTNLLYRP